MMAAVRRLLLIAAAAAAALAPAARAERIGRSVQGRPIGVTRIGAASAPVKVLVVGSVHGNEPAGRAIAARLAAGRAPAGVQLLVVRDLNPDGHAAGTRANAHGVDLNRNSADRWRPLAAPYFSGPRPFSEPESRAIRALIRRERPRLTLWYHQPLRAVSVPHPGSAALPRRYAALTGLPFRDVGPRPGSLSDWTNGLRGPLTSFVVELAGGPLSTAAARRHAAAVVALSRSLR
jgi:protein MpaA